MGSPSIPEEVVFEALARLPVKSLMRLRCVCKGWRSLIDDDPAFAKTVSSAAKTSFLLAILDQNLQRQHIFLADADGEPALRFILSLPCHARHQYCFCLSNSVDGLICFLTNDNQVYICNPAIQQIVMLPSSPFDWRDSWTKKLYMGYDPKAHTYKVLIVHIDTSCLISRVEIWTVGTQPQSWRRLEGLSAYLIRNEAWRTDPLVNGAIYWEGTNKEDEKEGVVVAFDIVKERFEVTPLPTGITSLFHLGGHNGQLFVIHKIKGSGSGSGPGEYRVWIMQTYPNKSKEEWVFHKSATFMELVPEWFEAFQYSRYDDFVVIHGWRDVGWTLIMKPKLDEIRAKKPDFMKKSGSSFDYDIQGVEYVESTLSLRSLSH